MDQASCLRPGSAGSAQLGDDNDQEADSVPGRLTPRAGHPRLLERLFQLSWAVLHSPAANCASVCSVLLFRHC